MNGSPENTFLGKEITGNLYARMDTKSVTHFLHEQ